MLISSKRPTLLQVSILFALLCFFVTAFSGAAFAADDQHTGADEPATVAESASNDKVIYLTFDDGPHNPYTQQLLDVLAKYNAKATFFVVGRSAAAQPELIAGIYAAGHGLANHTYSHRSLLGLGWETFRNEVAGGGNALGVHGSNCLRPPYGKTDRNTSAFAAKMGYHVVMWSIDPRDWTRPGAQTIASRVVSKAQPGAIVLLHDGGGDRSQTVAAVESVLVQLGEQGYSFAAMCRDGAPPPSYFAPMFTTLDASINGIVAPAANSSVSGQVSVTGAAAHPEFRKWQLDLLLFGDEAQSTFLALGETPMPSVAELLRWDTTLYPNGTHLLRLRVVREGANYDEFFTPVTVVNN